MAETIRTRRRAFGGAGGTVLLLALPFGVLFLVFYIAPILFAVYRSLFVLRRSGLGLTAPTQSFDPFANYIAALTNPDFLAGIGRVLLFGVVQVPLMLVFATVLALLLDSASVKLPSLFRLTSFLPYAVPGVIAALMWSFLYSRDSSPINQLLEPLGISIPFLSEDLALWAVANVVTWGWTGYNMIIVYSALQSIPAEVIEAARLDGASAWNIAWRVKVPMVRSAVILTAIFSIIGTAQLYNEPSVLQAISGGSISSTFTPIMAAQSAASAQNYPLAAAMSVILAVGVGVLSWVFFRLTSRGEE